MPIPDLTTAFSPATSTRSSRRPRLRSLAGAAAALSALGVLSCCSSAPSPGPVGTTAATAAVTATPPTTPGGPSTGAPTSEPPMSAPGLVLESGWVKAGNGMTALFGTVRNAGTEDVTLVSGTSPAASQIQIHTMTKQADGTMKMVQKPNGLTIPAGGSTVLAPGADHIMLIGLTAPLENGDEVRVRMETAAGTGIEWTVPVRSFSGADETYVPQMGTMAPTP